MSTRKGGRPPIYKSPAEMKKRIDYYFDEYCKGEPLLNKDGNPCLDKMGQPIYVHANKVTITGLARVLGFKSKQSLINYQGRKGYEELITDAKMRVEEHYEGLTQTRDGANGAMFVLRNSFKDWDADKPKQDACTAAVTIVCDIPKTPVVNAAPCVEEEPKEEQKAVDADHD